MEQQTAVEWLCKEEENLFISYQKGFMSLGRYTLLKHKLFEKAKQMEKEQKIKAQIEILRAIGNNGMNAPLYGILKDNLIILEEQLTKL